MSKGVYEYFEPLCQVSVLGNYGFTSIDSLYISITVYHGRWDGSNTQIIGISPLQMTQMFNNKSIIKQVL